MIGGKWATQNNRALDKAVFAEESNINGQVTNPS